MLIEFTVGNYLSFKDKKTLSLEATNIRDFPENVIEVGKYKLLRSAVIYGANSSGKSNFLKALQKMRDMVITSANLNSTSEIGIKPFLLNTESEFLSSHFEILFLLEGIRYRYGFEADNKKITSEWLFKSEGKKEETLFIRDKDAIEITSDFEEGKGLEIKTRDNALFLSIGDQFNGSISKKIIEWFGIQTIFSGINHEEVKGLTSFFLEKENFTPWIKNFLVPLNLGFEDFAIVENDKDKSRIITYHNKFDADGKIIDRFEFDLLEQESSGTNKLYDMAGRLVFALKLGKLAIIDELDAKLHPLLTMAIVKLFNSKELNTENSQLIFATHDTNLLQLGCFRRDQIYFTEKNRLDETDLYSLVEYKESNGKKVRNDRSFENDYIEGRYGAIPYVGDFSKLMN